MSTPSDNQVEPTKIKNSWSDLYYDNLVEKGIGKQEAGDIFKSPGKTILTKIQEIKENKYNFNTIQIRFFQPIIEKYLDTFIEKVRAIEDKTKLEKLYNDIYKIRIDELRSNINIRDKDDTLTSNEEVKHYMESLRQRIDTLDGLFSEVKPNTGGKPKRKTRKSRKLKRKSRRSKRKTAMPTDSFGTPE
jgi:hypothetical protein